MLAVCLISIFGCQSVSHEKTDRITITVTGSVVTPGDYEFIKGTSLRQFLEYSNCPNPQSIENAWLLPLVNIKRESNGKWKRSNFEYRSLFDDDSNDFILNNGDVVYIGRAL